MYTKAQRRTHWLTGPQRVRVDKARFPLNADSMDSLKERVYEERIKILNEKLGIAIRQRDGFAEKFHAVTRKPYQERREDIDDCDAEIELAGKQLTLFGKND